MATLETLETVRQQSRRMNLDGHPNSYWGNRDHWYIVAGQSRDSNALERSNFASFEKALSAINPESVTIERATHWAVGWVENLMVDSADSAAIDCAIQILTALEEYPVVNEEHYSQTEYDEVCELWSNMSISDRVDACKSAGCNSLGARRTSPYDADPDYRLVEYLRTP